MLRLLLLLLLLILVVLLVVLVVVQLAGAVVLLLLLLFGLVGRRRHEVDVDVQVEVLRLLLLLLLLLLLRVRVVMLLVVLVLRLVVRLLRGLVGVVILVLVVVLLLLLAKVGGRPRRRGARVEGGAVGRVGVALVAGRVTVGAAAVHGTCRGGARVLLFHLGVGVLLGEAAVAEHGVQVVPHLEKCKKLYKGISNAG